MRCLVRASALRCAGLSLSLCGGRVMQTEARRVEGKKKGKHGRAAKGRARGEAAVKWQGSKATWSKERVVVVSAAASVGVVRFVLYKSVVWVTVAG